MTTAESASGGQTEREAIEADFFSALKRLRANQPEDPELAERAAKGKLKINVSTLAKEAGRSRTLIALEDCAYPNVREELRKGDSLPAASKRTAIDDLNERLEEAVKERNDALFWQAEHLQAREKAERKSQRLQEQLDDCKRKLSAALTIGPHLQKVKG